MTIESIDHVCVLVDRIEELSETASSRQAATELVLPLLTNLILMELPRLCFKFFLPLEIKPLILQSPGFRSDRIAIFELAWSAGDLLEMLRWRLRTASDDIIVSLEQISDYGIRGSIDQQLVQASNGSPRKLIRLGQLLLEAHFRRPSREARLTEQDLREAIEHLYREFPQGMGGPAIR